MADYSYTIACYLSTGPATGPVLLRDAYLDRPSIVDGQNEFSDMYARFEMPVGGVSRRQGIDAVNDRPNLAAAE